MVMIPSPSISKDFIVGFAVSRRKKRSSGLLQLQSIMRFVDLGELFKTLSSFVPSLYYYTMNNESRHQAVPPIAIE
jgi:hypothetical protein